MSFPVFVNEGWEEFKYFQAADKYGWESRIRQGMVTLVLKDFLPKNMSVKLNFYIVSI